MERKRWQEVERVYQQMLEYLTDACAGDESLRRTVESLLAAHREAETFLETPALEMAARALVEQAKRLPPD